MAFARTEIKELEPMVKSGKKKFVRYQEGAELYSMGLHTFEELAREAGAIYKIRRVCPCESGNLRGILGHIQNVKLNTPFLGVLHIGKMIQKITFAASLQDRSNLCILRTGRTQCTT